MQTTDQLSRRAVLQGLGAIPAFGVLSSKPREFEYIATPTSINVFRAVNRRRIWKQCVPSQNPSFLALDESRRYLFAANEISEYHGLPAGSVESYYVCPGSGHLSLVSRQSLSLSATLPRGLAISPDRQYLVVAAYGGGACNVLPIHRNGELGRVTQVVKTIGRGVHPQKQATAHPHSLVFHFSGKFLLGTDLGSDLINVFNFRAGCMTRLSQIEAPRGSGPAQLTMNPAGSLVFVRHEFTRLLSCYRFNAETGHMTYFTSRSS